MNILNKNFFPIKSETKNSNYFYIPYFLLLIWIFLSVISIGFISLKNIFNGYVIFSIAMRLTISIIGLYLFNRIFLDRKNDKTIYNIFKAFVGYGFIFTYVFYSLPRLVGELLGNVSETKLISDYVLVLIITVFPAILYLFIRSQKTRLILGFFTQKEIDFEKKIKKDKELKKIETKKIKSERNFLVNLWYEWIDVIIQAVIIALLIQQFIFQMYQIPSESMVPTFLVKDRVVVNKMIYGPHIPLTDWKLPAIFKPKIGDIVVFENPEMDNPDSDIKYKNVFTRIFHQFLYMITVSVVDIEKYPKDYPIPEKRGQPKEKFIVKRCIAKEGEKICLVNDKVYKKTKDSDWKLMSEIKGQKEYGKVNLNRVDYPKLLNQLITKDERENLNKAQGIFEKDSIDTLKKRLRNEKSKFINSLKSINYDILMNNLKKVDDEVIQNKIFNYLNDNNYLYVTFYYSGVRSFEEHLSNSKGNLNYFEKGISTKIILDESLNPYKKYMKRVNAVYKIYELKLFQHLLNFFINIDYINSSQFNLEKVFTNDFFIDIENYFLIENYTEGYLFYFRNFPEYPKGNNEYIKKDEYFLMGDNRYNSHDCRFNGINNNENNDMIQLDEDDNSIFSKKLLRLVDWAPNTIKMKYVLGKAEIIFYPFDRIKKL